MLSQVEQSFARAARTIGLGAALAFALSACKVDIQDGVFACATTSDCPAGFRCDPASKHCTRHPQASSSERPDASASNTSMGAVHEASKDAGHPEKHADAMPMPARDRLDAGVERVDAATNRGADMDAGNRPPQAQEPRSAGSGGSTPTAGGAGAPAEQAGAAAHSGTGGSAAVTDCAQGTYCYGFEAGPLDPSGALWPSPSADSGGLPPYGELTTTTYPGMSQNKVLVSRPSAKDGWPKATVGFTGPAAPFSKLVISFDYVAGEKLVDPNPRVILFRFVGMPERNGDSVNVGLLRKDAMLEVQTDGPDPLTTIGPATAPGTLTHVVATLTRKPPACTVEVVYGSLPLTAAAFPCEVERWQIEFGLDMLETPPEQYTQDYSAYYDNLRVSSTP